MPQADYARVMAAYNQWMNRKVYAVCEGIPAEARERDLGAFFGSIHGTLDHVLWGDRIWMGRLTGRDYGRGSIGVLLYADFGELRAARESMDEEIVRWAGSLTEAWLAAQLTWTSTIDGRTRAIPNWVAVMQLFNHQTHHRGQATTLLKQLGHDPGETDIPWLPGLGAMVGGSG
jgi:uncharacterized damage-inducible protein DinB